ncbi:hypothetical protein GCM10010376_65570 [Streptomyces violaceusniger]
MLHGRGESWVTEGGPAAPPRNDAMAGGPRRRLALTLYATPRVEWLLQADVTDRRGHRCR